MSMDAEDFVALALAEAPTHDRGGMGYSLRFASGNPNPPGCIALTWIAGRDAAERQRIRDLARRNVEDFGEQPGFISIVTGFIGLRGFTVTAWETEDAMTRALSHNHAAAMRALFGESFVASVWTSVWTPTRVNRLWVRCEQCGSLENTSGAAEDVPTTCGQCQAALPERPLYW